MSENNSEIPSGHEGLLAIGLFLVVFVMGADSFIISPLLPAIARSYQTTVEQAALAVTAYALGYAGGAPFFGPLGDYFDKKRLLASGVSLFLMGSVLCAIAPTLPILLGCRLIAGIGAALTLPNVWATIGTQFKGLRMQWVMGIVMAALSLSIAVGVPLGATVAQLSDWHMAFWASSIVGLVAAIVLLLLVPSMPMSNRGPLSYGQRFRELRRQTTVVSTLGITLIWMFGFYLIYTFLGTVLIQQFQLNTAQSGTIFIGYGLSNFGASFFGGWVMMRLGTLRSIVMTGLVSALCAVGLAFSETLPLLMGWIVVLAVNQGFGVTALSAHIVAHAGQSRSTAMAVNSSLLYLGLTLASLVGGVGYTTLGFRGLCLMAAITFGLAGCLADGLNRWADVGN
ncbi:MFS transporter [Levilactobacillus brevis]|uniref:MFS transporter n=1 Tax=Levilactobacillus brevis TaxID=1580 RepID=UPI001BDF5DC0|nr:MFS transporter [Levilactobacillus brevis]